MRKYKSVFFDLDHTLWDFEKNSIETLEELYDLHNLEQHGVSGKSDFIREYTSVNKSMWDQYHRNEINKETLRAGRFNRTLNTFNISNMELSEILASQYLERCPEKRNLFPGTIQTLEQLGERYNLHIITNGFKEVQYRKIKNSGLNIFFKEVHISEEIGFKKPQPEIFHYAVKQSGSLMHECIMIGDNIETDIEGAIQAGIDHIYFNPENQPVPEYIQKVVQTIPDLLTLL